jgi:hypothetical protein
MTIVLGLALWKVIQFRTRPKKEKTSFVKETKEKVSLPQH